MKVFYRSVLYLALSIFFIAGFTVYNVQGEMMMHEKTGMLEGYKGHNAAGKVALTKDDSGNSLLVLSDIKVDKVPDGWVYLAKGGDYLNGVELGMLKQFTGTVRFTIPKDVNTDEYDGVVIWCKKFDVGIGKAFFAKEMMEEKGMMKEKEKMK
jgi:hypothetical protein